MKIASLTTLVLLLTACGQPPTSRDLENSRLTARFESLPRLQAGDVILVPLNCYVCNAIEAETGTPYSHSVVVANTTSNPEERFVFEAWGEVKKTRYTDIQNRKQKNQPLYLLRAKQFTNNRRPSEKQFNEQFQKNFNGLPFDDEYLWENTTDQGAEKLYCAEFVLKFINMFMAKPVAPSPMSFSKNSEFWNKYYQQFGMKPPSGKIGASPATLFNSPLMLHLGEIDAQE